MPTATHRSVRKRTARYATVTANANRFVIMSIRWEGHISPPRPSDHIIILCLSLQDYTCKCENGYKGVVCSTLACKKGKLEGSEEEKECYGAGTCVDGECECYQGYSGDACQDKEVCDLQYM